MNVVLNPVGSHGDVHPFLALGRELARRGHAVTMVTAAPFGPLARDAGFAFAPTGTVEDYEALTHHPDVWHPTKSFKVLLGRPESARMLTTAYRAIREAVAGDVQNSVVVSGSLGLAARVARDALGVRLLTAHLQPSSVSSVASPPRFPSLKVPGWWPRAGVRLLYYVGERWVLDPVVGPAVNGLRRELNLPPQRRIMGAWRHSPDGLLLAFPRWFADAPDWPDHAHATGFIRHDRADTTPLAPELTAFLDAGDAPVVASFGTAMRQGHAAIHATVAACQKLQRRLVILAKSGPQVPTPLPPGVIQADYAPFSRVFPRAAVVVHHGGIGTSAEAIAAGVPHLVRPMAFDQFDNAERLTALGVARWLAPKHFTADAAARELATLTNSLAVRESCGRLQAQLLADPPGERVMADLVERLAGGMTALS